MSSELTVVAPADGTDIKTPAASPGGAAAEDGAPAEDAGPQDELLEVPISWTKAGARSVSVFTSYDDFEVPIELVAEEQQVKGKTKVIWVGTLNLPVGSHLIQFDVDGTLTYDDKRPMTMARGSEYNSLVVSKPDDAADAKSAAAAGDSKSAAGASGETPGLVWNNETGTLKIDTPAGTAAHAAAAGGKRKSVDLGIAVPAAGHTRSQSEAVSPSVLAAAVAGEAAKTSTTSGAARRKKKKAAMLAAGLLPGKDDDVDDGPDEPDTPQAGSKPSLATSIAGSKKLMAELQRKEQEWREAWIMNELRTNQIRETEKVAMRNTWSAERTVWLQRIKQYGNEAKELREKTLALQAQLDAAESGAKLNTNDVARSEGRAQQETVFLQEEINRMKKRIGELQTEKDNATAALQATNTRLEQSVASLQTESAVSRAALETTKRELEDARKEQEVIRNSAKSQNETLEKEISKMRQAALLKGSTGEKKSLAMKKTFNAEMFQIAGQLDKAEKENAEYKRKIAELEAGSSKSQSSSEAAANQLAESEAKLKAALAQVAASQSQLESVNAALSDTKTKHAQLSVNAAALNTELESLKQQHKSAAGAGNAALTDAQSALADAKRRTTTLEGELKLTTEALTAKLSDSEAKRAQEIKNLTEASAAVTKQLEAAKKDIASLTTEKSSLESALKTEKAAAEDALRTKKRDAEQAAAKLDEVKEESAANLATLKRESQAKVDEANTKLNQLKAELEAAVKALTDSKAARSTVGADLEKTKTELAAATVSLDKQGAKINELTANLAKQEAERNALKSKFETAASELEGKLAGLQKSLLEKQTSLDKTVSDLEREKSARGLEQAASAREKKELSRQIDELQKTRSTLKAQVLAVHQNAKKLRAALDKIRAGQMELQKENAKTITDTRKFLLDALLVQSKLLQDTMKKYKEEMTERRKYFNLVQELRGNIRVYCRSRPFLKTDEEKNTTNAVGFPQENIITVKRVVNSKDVIAEYEFDRVFVPTNNQVDVFNDTKALVVSCMDGYNVCIFAYGQTGSGKTFTMEGPAADRGVNFRALSELFRLKAARKDYSYKISVSMKEVYNEKIRDLLASKDDGEQDYKIRSGENGTYVEGLTLVEVQTEDDVLALMKRGNQNRSVGQTNMNEHSSRSHSLLSVEVQGENRVAGVRYFGKLHLIDLAGSERLSKTAAVGDRLKEAQAINKSLACLGNVIQALQKKEKHVPYRDSKLTFLLQDSLGNNAKTLMFINVSPTAYDAEETNNSLLFATRVRKTELGKAEKNETKSSGDEDGAATPSAAATPKSAATTSATPTAKAAAAAKPAASAAGKASTPSKTAAASKVATPVKKPAVAPKTPTAKK